MPRYALKASAMRATGSQHAANAGEQRDLPPQVPASSREAAAAIPY